MMVEHPKAHIVHDAVKTVRHHKAAGDLDIRAQNLQQGSGKHIVGVELAGVGEAVCRNFHKMYLVPNKMSGNSIAHFAERDNEKPRNGTPFRGLFERILTFSLWCVPF